MKEKALLEGPDLDLAAQITADSKTISLTKAVQFEIFSFRDWSCPLFNNSRVSPQALEKIGMPPDYYYSLEIAHIGGGYEVLMVNCAWPDRNNTQSKASTDGNGM